MMPELHNYPNAAILEATETLLSSPGAWTQGVRGRDAKGKPLPHEELRSAKCWCVVGAIYVCAGGYEGGFRTRLLIHGPVGAVEQVVGEHLATWNDRRGRTQSEVIAALQVARLGVPA